MLATRNLGDEEANPSPGYWNHLAIMGPNGWVVEAQAGREHGVIAVPWSTFFNRYPEIVAFQPAAYPQAAGLKVALAAASRLGEPYHRVGGNCVVLQRASIEHVMHRRARWRKPDDAVPSQAPHGRDEGTVLWLKRPPPGFEPISNPFLGETTNPSDILRAAQ